MGPFTDEDYKDIEIAHDAAKRVYERSACPKNKAVIGLYKAMLALSGLVLAGKMNRAMRDAPGRER